MKISNIFKFKAHLGFNSCTASGAKILLSSTSLLDGSRWFANFSSEFWRLELDVFQQFICSFGEFSKWPKYQKFLKFLEIRQIIIEFNWIDFCNLLGRVCKHGLLKSSSNTPRKWNDYITSAGPLVGNRCWIQPAGRAKACETSRQTPQLFKWRFFLRNISANWIALSRFQVNLWESGGQIGKSL